MNLLDRLLKWVGDTASTKYRERHAARLLADRMHRKGIGEQVFSGSITGTATFGWPGGWGADRIEQVLHYKHWVYVAVRAIAQEIAGLTPKLAWVDDGTHGGGERAANEMHYRAYIKSQGQVHSHERIEFLPPNHPLCRLFASPNEWDTSSDIWYELILFLQLTGNAYLWVPPSKYGIMSGTHVPCELWVMPSHWVWPRVDKFGIKFYEIRPFVGPGTLIFPPNELIHFKWPNPLHKLDGWSPQTAGAEFIDTEESIRRALFWQMKNGAFPLGNLELGEQYADPDDADLERIYAKFFARLQGETNFGRPIITPPGAKYTPLTINPAEMAYGETLDRLRDNILSIFGVPKEIAGIQDAGSEIAMYGPMMQFSQRTVNPIVRYLGQVITRHLCRRYDPRIRCWWEDTTPTSPQTVNADLGIDLQYGIITPDEARAIRGRRPYTPAEEKRYAKLAGQGEQPAPGAGMPGIPAPNGPPMPGAPPMKHHANGRVVTL